ncbi:Insulin-like growth factor binding protein, N-terminal [Pseudocohnilembus persalinus]|uniref:Insulin-like growth factor binding protein, N-terminal n=1 Tax=Pseudocohnilembus persalinus TaxID=266149 RepID=A0A0V0QB01_PSEPJ|nr:Insulin-like growth factor binding protein, N-terminal [Pseudocohnilembus persalinus]|eukprot:KRW99236.1 Insulin-like growth factor binding protein, N-terminal [Pseudocohnilembus persalinus]
MIRKQSNFQCTDGDIINNFDKELNESKPKWKGEPCLSCDTADICNLCKDTYYLHQDNCNQCSYQCQNCSSEQICTSCPDNSYRIPGEKCLCEQYYFDNGYDPICQPCKFPCLTCVDQENICLTCDGEFREPSTCQCIDGYYETSDNICEPCDSNCSTCETTSDNCLTCKYGLFRAYEPPSCECLQGYFATDLNNNCVKCKKNCKTCDNPETCSKCINNISLLPYCNNIQGQYYSKQIEGKYIDFQCPIQCKTCDENGECLTCQNGVNRINTPPECPCQQGYYQDKKGVCEKIDSTCIQWNYEKYYCEKCIQENMVVNKFTGLCECKKGYSYFDSFTCKKCYWFRQYCLQTCPKSTYFNEQNQICEEIHYIDKRLNKNQMYKYAGCLLFAILFGYLIFVLKIRRLFKKLHQQSEQLRLKNRQEKEQRYQQLKRSQNGNNNDKQGMLSQTLQNENKELLDSEKKKSFQFNPNNSIDDGIIQEEQNDISKFDYQDNQPIIKIADSQKNENIDQNLKQQRRLHKQKNITNQQENGQNQFKNNDQSLLINVENCDE